MCVYSMIVDHYTEKWSHWLPVNPSPTPPLVSPLLTPSELDDFGSLLRRAVRYDDDNAQSDCELEAKKEKLRDLARQLGARLTFPGELTLVVAMDMDRCIGDRGGLPWRQRDDQRRFRQLTLGGAVIVGRRTFESLPQPLDGRRVVVLTRDASYAIPATWGEHDVRLATTLSEGVAACGETPTFVIGGAHVYRQFIARASCLEVTRIAAVVNGDASFPEIDDAWRLQASSPWRTADANNSFPWRYETWVRR